MLTISADAHALIAQIIAVIVFASIVELRKAFNAQTTYELKFLVGAAFVAGLLSSGGVLISRVVDAAEGGSEVETTWSMFWWVAFQFLWPLATLVIAQALKLAGQVLSGKKSGAFEPMTSLFRELGSSARSNGPGHTA